MTPIYLDHSATTPVDPRVVDAMLPYFTEVYGNASSGHAFGRDAEKAIEDARETIAGVLNCQPHEIIFTGCGSESDNLAVRGAAWAGRRSGKGKHLITTPIEHGAIGKTVEQLAQFQGFESTILPVDGCGTVSVDEFRAACRPTTTVASVIYANNEVGTIQPIAALAAAAHGRSVLFHTDAVQAAGQLDLDVQRLGVDLLSISGHKFYGPKGVGALYVRDGVNLIPAQTGGGHERGLRAGTHNTPLIVGLAAALKLAYDELAERTAYYQSLRDQLITGILSAISTAQLTGHPEHRLSSHASFVFEGLENFDLLGQLNEQGIAASAASACKTGNTQPSSVLLALGYGPELASSSLRLTVGLHTTQSEIDCTVETLARIICNLPQTTPLTAVPVA
ncbi:MAG TPA: cysteine desulfurase family protein [Phototrophicaceae bacterium]|nr:cysteine desulfurase family protein [Phototrophicaceae bacterium]